MSTKLHVKKGDTVCLMTGKYSDKYADDKGTRKTGKVLEVSPKEGKVIVEGINVVIKACETQKNGRDRRHRESGSADLCMQGTGCTAPNARSRFAPESKWTATRKSASAKNAAKKFK